MTRLHARPPYDMADARRILTDPAAHRGHPAIRQTAWQFLKEARGEAVDFERLDAMHGTLQPAPRRTLADDLIARAEAVIPRIRARRDQLLDGEGA
jgi:hypothetical protein